MTQHRVAIFAALIFDAYRHVLAADNVDLGMRNL